MHKILFVKNRLKVSIIKPHAVPIHISSSVMEFINGKNNQVQIGIKEVCKNSSASFISRSFQKTKKISILY